MYTHNSVTGLTPPDQWLSKLGHSSARCATQERFRASLVAQVAREEQRAVNAYLAYWALPCPIAL